MTRPEFATWINPVLSALRELGGTARPSEVVEKVARDQNVPDTVLDRENQGGVSRFGNQVHWARYYLAEAGFIDRSVRGVWRLTQLGQQKNSLTTEEISSLITSVQEAVAGVAPRQKTKRSASATSEAVGNESERTPDQETVTHRARLTEILQGLSPGGFERLCQRLLREAGFEQVVVTGRSGDGGIDGHGVLGLNAFVSFRVLFQCKRYQGAVSPSQVRDFRGALQGRADKGIILTTGTFSVEARREAGRDGAPPIELVDGEKLIDLFEQLELGLRPRKAYELDASFFTEYQT